MPCICAFDGIEIEMYIRDHAPPHFHAYYAEYEAVISINDVTLLKGGLPSRKLKLVTRWAIKRQEELLINWELRENGKPLLTLLPL